jgi:putative spermidine/putrescine transport system ATP-binding protein
MSVVHPKLSIQGISKRYGKTTALEPTSVDVEEGEFLTLLGPSGSGKTTLLNLIAGLVPADGGRVVLDGQDITFAAPQHRGLGMVFQNYALFPHLSVAQNIAFGLDVRGQSQAQMQARVAEILAIVRLQDYAQRLPKELSGGQQQRVALARAFAYSPKVVLMDEPLGALDRYLREEMKTEIARLHKELGTTVIYVTHDQEEALVLSDRICLMNHAKIEQLASPQSLYFEPQSRFAAEFLGESNLLPARVNASKQAALVSELNINISLLPSQNRFAEGQAGHLLQRPEAINFTPTLDHGVDWKIERKQFVGAWLRYTLIHQSGLRLTATRPCTGPMSDLEIGSSIQVHWQAMHFIPDSALAS